MNKSHSFQLRLHGASFYALLSLSVAASLWLTHIPVVEAQTADPTPTPADTPTVNPTPAPTATPGDTPNPTASPGDTPAPIAPPAPSAPPNLLDPAVLLAYTAARTPLVDVTLSTAATGGSATSGISASAAPSVLAATAVRQRMQGNRCMLTTLQPPATPASKTSHTNASTSGATSQPVATVVLTYDPSNAGQLVWVQMTGIGTLTADDGAGHTYDGSNGFFLTLDANAMATFNYQAPNRSGTYQVLTRFSNVVTILPFFVPDPAPAP